ncbi:MAG: ArsR family transcriptional regulator [Anaerolineaceae bacterium]|nr:ArsR family transcriptional regulator [Anaerolineaceae bacterium]
MFDVDRILHEPARLMITTILYTAEEADFLFLLQQTGLTKGNLSAHLSKLEKEDYVEIEKTYRGKVPQTLCRLTKTGRKAFEDYRRQLNKILKEMK